MAPLQLNRRAFLQGAIAAVALPDGLCSTALQHTGREQFTELPYSAVKLTGGPLKAQYDWVHAHYLSLCNDNLLHGYRQQAGLSSPGVELGGWYASDGFVPGHSLGQYISGLARIGACTGDSACAEKVKQLVTGFAETLGSTNQSLLSAKTNLWTCYTLDKHFAGLIDAYSLTGIGEAKELLTRVLSGATALMPSEGRDRVGKKDPPYDETYVMPENLLSAYEITGDVRFLEIAFRYLLDREFFDPLARGEDVLPGRHAYSHAIALSSAAKAYLFNGDAKYRRAMENAWNFIVTEQQFASGGWGPNEQFLETHKGRRYDSLASTVDHFETPCGAYAATKLARYLLRFSGDPHYGDNLERLIYNTILAVKPPDNAGDYPYYSTYSPHAEKVWYKAKWPCCSGTLVQTVADYVLNLYMQSVDGIVVNLYAPSELQWQQADRPVRLEQTTEYPDGELVHLKLHMEQPSRFVLRLRIPSWAHGATLSINGKRVAIPAATGSFAVISRIWKDGDTVELRLPQSLRVEPIDLQHPNVVAIMRGPVMYAVTDMDDNLSSRPYPLLKSLRSNDNGYLLAINEKNLPVLPFYQITDKPYTTYLRQI